MKILIEMSREHYDSLLGRVTKESCLYSTLMSSMTLHESEAIRTTDTIMTVCEEDEAKALLQFAQQCCPEADTRLKRGSNYRGLPSNTKIISLLSVR
jgi:hypothetical protein